MSPPTAETHNQPTQIRIASYNIAKNYAPHGIQNILKHLNIDYLAIQEPPTSPITPLKNTQHDKPLKYQHAIYSTLHSKIIISPSISHHIINHITFADGRGQITILQFTHTVLAICAMYDYQHHHKKSLIPPGPLAHLRCEGWIPPSNLRRLRRLFIFARM